MTSSGLPMPREPAYAAKRSQDGEAPAASERARAGCPQRASGGGAWADPSGAAVREPYRFRDWAFWRRADHISQAIGSTDTSTMPTTTSSKFSFTIGKLPKK